MANANSPRANRRSVLRTTCQIAVEYVSKGHRHPATAMDLSRLGCRLRLGESLPRAHALTLFIDCTRSSGEVLHAEVKGQVVWSRLEGLSYQCGIQFDDEVPALQAILADQQ